MTERKIEIHCPECGAVVSFVVRLVSLLMATDQIVPKVEADDVDHVCFQDAL